MKPSWRWLPGFLLLAAFGACGDDDARDVPDATDDGETTPDVPGPDADADGDEDAAGGDEGGEVEPADDGGGDVPVVCLEPGGTCTGEACHAPPYALHCVGGTVRDPTGAPIADQAVVLCAAMRCYFTTSRADGWFAATIPASVASVAEIAVYFPSDPPRHSPFCRFDALCDGSVELCTDFRLYPAPTTGTAVPTGALTAEVRVEAADGAALVLPAGAELLPPIGAPSQLALSRFPLEEHVPCFLDPADLPTALYVVTPLDSEVIEPGTIGDVVLRPAGLDLPNPTGLVAGTVVDVFVVGGAHPQDAGLEEGEWSAVTTATVTGDGTRIRTAAGEGLGYLTWFGIYPR